MNGCKKCTAESHADNKLNVADSMIVLRTLLWAIKYMVSQHCRLSFQIWADYDTESEHRRYGNTFRILEKKGGWTRAVIGGIYRMGTSGSIQPMTKRIYDLEHVSRLIIHILYIVQGITLKMRSGH